MINKPPCCAGSKTTPINHAANQFNHITGFTRTEPIAFIDPSCAIAAKNLDSCQRYHTWCIRPAVRVSLNITIYYGWLLGTLVTAQCGSECVCSGERKKKVRTRAQQCLMRNVNIKRDPTQLQHYKAFPVAVSASNAQVRLMVMVIHLQKTTTTTSNLKSWGLISKKMCLGFVRFSDFK